MKDLIQRLCSSAPGADPEDLACSDWMTDKSDDEINAIVDDCSAQFDRFAVDLVAVLGTPDVSTDEARDAVAAWYPEAIRAACWSVDGKTICLGLEHHDRETPIGIVLRCLTAQEITELSE